MNKRKYSIPGILHYQDKLSCGLDLHIIKKPGFAQKYAIIGTNYGSNDHNFMMDGKTYHTNRGIAHFLEHKLFEMPDGTDAFVSLTNLGCYSNAFTSNNKTCYMISTPNDFQEGLEILLDFVFTPYFDEESVNREKSIIAAEINMYKDYPDYVLEVEVMKNLYHESTLSEDIAGEVSDIMGIDSESLHVNYQAFYQPSNMALVLSGDFDIDEIKKALEKKLSEFSFKKHDVAKMSNIEKSKILNHHVEITGNVMMDKFIVAIKFDKMKDTISLKEEQIYDALFNLLFSNSSQNYQKLLERGIVHDDLNFRIEFGENFRFVIISGNSHHPEKAIKEIESILFSKELQITEDDLFIYKRKTVGDYLKGLNKASSEANAVLAFSLLGLDFHSLYDYINEIELSDLADAQSKIRKENIVTGILKKE